MYPLQFVTYVVTSASLTPRPPKIGTRIEIINSIISKSSQDLFLSVPDFVSILYHKVLFLWRICIICIFFA